MATHPTVVRIAVAAQPATQSGKATAGAWVLQFRPAERPRIDPLTGWAGSGDMRQQVQLSFPTREAAVAYAESKGYLYEVEEPPPAKPIRPKIYADNFRYGRSENWTH
ncbi:MAG: ETC complex I subunit [Acetobacteraceae bacterium]|nr:ETC complex I subunit [Acetobacteraceae bacterium]